MSLDTDARREVLDALRVRLESRLQAQEAKADALEEWKATTFARAKANGIVEAILVLDSLKAEIARLSTPLVQSREVEG